MDVNGSHRGDNKLVKQTGIQIATESLPRPSTLKHRTFTICVKMVCLWGASYSVSAVWNVYIYIYICIYIMYKEPVDPGSSVGTS